MLNKKLKDQRLSTRFISALIGYLPQDMIQ